MSCNPVLFQVQLRGFSRDLPEVFMEAGEIGKAAFVAELFDADAVVDEELTGVADADLCEELGIGLAGAGFEIAAERIRHQAGHCGYLVEIDLPGKMMKSIIVDGIDPVMLRIGKIRTKADG